VAEWRIGQIGRMPNVSVYPGSLMLADDVLEAGRRHIIVATGAVWRRDGVGRALWRPIPGCEDAPVFTPDDLLSGSLPEGRVLIYDDDHYYMGGVLAELLVSKGCQVSLATPSTKVSEWTVNTLEQNVIQAHVLELGVSVRTSRALMRFEGGEAELACAFTGKIEREAFDALVLVTARLPEDSLYRALIDARERWERAGIRSVKVIGDAAAPAAIAWATYAGHRYAEELDAEDRGDALPFRRDVTACSGA
jgi:dimethylamine/trimethylamine dehydrogenase